MTPVTIKSKSILVVDSDMDFLTKITADPAVKQTPAIIAPNGKTAQLALANQDYDIAAIFINNNVLSIQGSPGWISVVRHAHQHRMATPIYAITDDKSPISQEELSAMAIQKMLKKPLSYEEMAKMVIPEAIHFDPQAIIAAAGKNASEALDTEITAEDAMFVPIRADKFIAGTKSFFDVYIRLKAGKYVKLLTAGDNFTIDRISGYLKKGVTQFFLKKDAQVHYLNYCDQLAVRILNSNKISTAAKVDHVLNHGEETMSFLRTQGLSEQNIQYAKQYIGNVHALVQKLDPEKHSILKEFMKSIISFEHGVGTCMLAGLLAEKLGMQSVQSTEIVGLAAMLHDIGLYRLPAEVQDEDESKMTPEQKVIYHTHPVTGAMILQGIKGIHPVIIQAVTQHHERRDESGFPARLGLGEINRVAEIIGVCDEFAHMISRATKVDKAKASETFKLNFLDGFSHPVAEAFRSVFLAGISFKKASNV